jgi:hypothetical protein
VKHDSYYGSRLKRQYSAPLDIPSSYLALVSIAATFLAAMSLAVVDNYNSHRTEGMGQEGMG